LLHVYYTKKHEEGAKKHEGFAGMEYGTGCPKFGMKIFMIDNGFWTPHTLYPIPYTPHPIPHTSVKRGLTAHFRGGCENEFVCFHIIRIFASVLSRDKRLLLN
jgi:saccharopine dehydrogenase-like NADP-dependent oxidoreductase